MLATPVIDSQKLLEADLKARRFSLATFITRISFIAGCFISVTALIAWALMPQFTQLLIYASVVGVLSAASWAYPKFASWGKEILGGSIYLGAFMILAIVCPVVMPDTMSGVMVVYVCLSLMSNIFLSRRGFWIILVGGIVSITFDLLYLDSAWMFHFPTLPYILGPVNGWVIALLTFIIISFYLRMILTSQDALYGEVHQSKFEMEQLANSERGRRMIIQKTFNDYARLLKQVQLGNLSVRIPFFVDELETGDEDEDLIIGLGRQINETINALEKMINHIRETALGLSSASAEIGAAVSQQASGSAQQSAAISQTTTTVAEVRTIAVQAVERAQEVVDAAQQTAEVSQSGKQAIEETIQAMQQIKNRVEGISQNILELSEQTQQIGHIIATVNEIAAQSNMLALNASVEAARAGEHGKGFAVVAAEVRNLAEQSKRSTAQVKGILQEIQKATNASVMTTEEGIKVVDAGVQKASRSYDTIDQLNGVITESVNRMMQVMAGGRQQATGMEQVSHAMQNIQQVSLQSLTSTRQAERSAQDLNELASQLNQALAQYDHHNIGNQVDFTLARLNHKNWIKRLLAFMDGKEALTEASAVSHHDCALGQWLYSTGLTKYKGLAEMRELERVHQEFHEGVKRVVRLKNGGNLARAELEMQAVQANSDRIFELIYLAERQVGDNDKK